MERPTIVCLCGSTRFKEDFERVQLQESLAGKIVLSVACFGHSGDLPPEQCRDGHPTKTQLDQLHLRKIDLADEVFVVNRNGYIGESTRREIHYAFSAGKIVRYLEFREEQSLGLYRAFDEPADDLERTIRTATGLLQWAQSDKRTLNRDYIAYLLGGLCAEICRLRRPVHFSLAEAVEKEKHPSLSWDYFKRAFPVDVF